MAGVGERHAFVEIIAGEEALEPNSRVEHVGEGAGG